MAVTSELQNAVASADRAAKKLRSGSLYREARAKFDIAAAEWRKDVVSAHQSQTLHDEILDIERGSLDRQERPRWGEVVQRVRADCRACGSSIPASYLVERRNVQKHFPERVEDEIPAPCPVCHQDPWSSPGASTFNTIDFKPYYDISLGKNAVCPPGVRYVPKKGHWIESPGQLADLARLNGRSLR